jgi:hypothetical protein
MAAVANAADQISEKKTKVDGQLFHIKHLLILREQARQTIGQMKRFHLSTIESFTDCAVSRGLFRERDESGF